MTDLTAVINPGPKSRFQGIKDNVANHRSMVDKPEFQRAVDFALLEYQRVLCEQRGDMSQAAACHLKLCGAQEFVHVLRNLSEVPQAFPTEKITNLNHRA